MTYRRPSISGTATGAVRCSRLVRARTVIITFGPIGRPRRSRAPVSEVDRRISAGARVKDRVVDMVNAPGHVSAVCLRQPGDGPCTENVTGDRPRSRLAPP